MTDILTLALSVLPFLVVVAFPILLVRFLDSATGAPEAAPRDLETLPPLERTEPRPVLASRPVSARA